MCAFADIFVDWDKKEDGYNLIDRMCDGWTPLHARITPRIVKNCTQDARDATEPWC